MWRRKIVDNGARERIEALEAIVRRLEDQAQELTDKLVRLRGKVYAHKLHLADDEHRSRETKADLLRKAGFTPGRPMVHKEG